MFNITGNKGVHITFSNGWTASIQWGTGNYCDNYSTRLSQINSPVPASNTAEFACWPTNGDLTNIWDSPEEINDAVKGHCTAEEILRLLNLVASQPNCNN